jgi:hypothetical protein
MKRNILAAFILLLSLSAGIEAQGLDQDCNPIAVPPECARLVGPIRELDDRISRLQERLKNASPAAKQGLLRSIEQLNTQLEAVRADLTLCKREHGATPRGLAPAELASNLSGTATLRTTDSEARGPFEVDFNVDIRFTRNRCGITVTRFPSIKLKTDNIPGLGKVAVTVTQSGVGSGTFHPVSGNMNIQIALHFHYDTFLVSDDDATFNLTTKSVPSGDGDSVATGSPLNAESKITLVGTATFHHGYLAGKLGGLLVKATVSPRP